MSYLAHGTRARSAAGCLCQHCRAAALGPRTRRASIAPDAVPRLLAAVEDGVPLAQLAPRLGLSDTALARVLKRARESERAK